MQLSRRQLKTLISETLILELGMGKNAYPFTRHETTAFRSEMLERVKYFFTTAPNKDDGSTYQYVVEISIDYHSSPMDQANEDYVPGGYYTIMFKPIAGPGIGRHTSAISLTGAVDFRLFSTIVAIIKDFATNIDRDVLYKDWDDIVTMRFEGTSESRNRLYKNLLKRNLGVKAKQAMFDGHVDDDAFEFELPDQSELE